MNVQLWEGEPGEKIKERSITQVSMGAVMVVCTLIRKISLIPHQVITYDVYISDK